MKVALAIFFCYAINKVGNAYCP